MMHETPRIPRKKGQRRNSPSHSDLYTDENPKGTIHGLGFKDVETAKASVAKIKRSGKTHAHKIQAAIAMEQRARVMGKTAEAAVYRKYINAMKKKTKEMRKEGFKTDANRKAAFAKMGDKKEDTGVLSPEQEKERAKRLAMIRKNRADDAKARQKENDKQKQMTQKESLWDNIRKKRERIKRGSGERMRKPGEKGAPKTLDIGEITTTASIPNPAQTAMGPTGKGMVSYVHDRRKRKKDHYALVKRFKDYLVQNGVI
tara:strand:- start:510 stop:1283 length:774 start_codon:yes stop_codon:yes gene_type:complete